MRPDPARDDTSDARLVGLTIDDLVSLAGSDDTLRFTAHARPAEADRAELDEIRAMREIIASTTNPTFHYRSTT